MKIAPISLRPADAHALLRKAFQEHDGDADRKDGNPLLDAKLGFSLAQLSHVRVVKAPRTSVPGALVSDRSSVADAAHCLEIEVPML